MTTRRPAFHPRRARVLMTLIMSALMVSFVSGVVTIVNRGVADRFAAAWLRAFAIAWPVAFLTAYSVFPLARRWTEKLTGGAPWNGSGSADFDIFRNAIGRAARLLASGIEVRAQRQGNAHSASAMDLGFAEQPDVSIRFSQCSLEFAITNIPGVTFDQHRARGGRPVLANGRNGQPQNRSNVQREFGQVLGNEGDEPRIVRPR